MLIGIDGNEANVKNRVGVNVYAYELLWAIYNLQDVWKDKFAFRIYLKKAPDNLPPESKFWQYKILPGKGVWIIRKLTPHLVMGNGKLDVFFTPSHYVPPFISTPRVCSIMDLGYLNFSDQFKRYDYWQLRLWSAYSIYVSKYIIAISNATKADIRRHYPGSKNKIIVTPLAYDKTRFNQQVQGREISRVKNKYTTGHDYILFLSTLKPSKNVNGLVEAWSKIESQFPQTKLVIAGKKGWLYEPIFRLVKEMKIEDRITFTDFVDEEDKPGLMAGAKVFVLPSFWEGFGLDVLNAFAVGTPVICSNRGSLSEVAGKASIVINPENLDEIALAIKKVLTMNNQEYNALREKGYEQASLFSWEKTAKETLQIFEKLRK